MAEILKGAPAAAALTEQLIRRAEALKERGVVPTLAILRVGEREDDISYETGARKRCAKVGVEVRQFLLPADGTKEQLLDAVREINADRSIHGCLMFRPLPDRDMENAACALLAPEKDVDGMTAGSLAAVYAGKGAGFAPCTAQAVMELLDHYGVALTGKRAVVVGRSLVIGRPVAMLLQQKNATVTMCHTRTADLPGECRRADVLVVAAGKAGVVTKDYVAPGQTVIDVGIHVGEDGKLCGDVKFDEAEGVVSAITPVPGGVGSVTTAVLCKHVIEAAERTAP
ncbi:MAG: bifunctional 5,10-methylene-tetrahydrofolate dehydrogenase/5,10-methylene-tetrahydrofolate cyclohydrolase [Oscillospiraceae bacterium]|nr:bifunctional 5,10-methylene-tetrahydrofolate dehydrogenase/5,10-methylene-tetrahydrofolate cyclohydrolase [Oscillospiraceae bacterium]